MILKAAVQKCKRTVLKPQPENRKVRAKGALKAPKAATVALALRKSYEDAREKRAVMMKMMVRVAITAVTIAQVAVMVLVQPVVHKGITEKKNPRWKTHLKL